MFDGPTSGEIAPGLKVGRRSGDRWVITREHGVSESSPDVEDLQITEFQAAWLLARLGSRGTARREGP